MARSLETGPVPHAPEDVARQLASVWGVRAKQQRIPFGRLHLIKYTVRVVSPSGTLIFQIHPEGGGAKIRVIVHR